MGRWKGGRLGPSPRLCCFLARGATELIAKPLHTLSIQPEMGGQGLHHSAISRMAGGLSLSAGSCSLSLSPFRICMFIPSRAFAYLPLSPPPDRAVPLNKWTRAVHPPCLSLSVAARSLAKCANNSRMVRSCPPSLLSRQYRHSAPRALQGMCMRDGRKPTLHGIKNRNRTEMFELRISGFQRGQAPSHHHVTSRWTQ